MARSEDAGTGDGRPAVGQGDERATNGRRRVRVLVAKPGLDGHDRGAKIVAHALRDAGMEVSYTGIRRTPEQIADRAVTEQVDVLGLSILSGAHLTLTERVIEALRAREVNLDDLVIIVGGIIPEDDISTLREMGVAAVFGPGTPMRDVIEFIEAAVA